ncbi:hypothetical protein CYMTET_15383 [Cymbomonas tetramitiformis]|uniref:Uncharacterized protein n=1 Tax=Cymbomonas tetramitiformis TaxID=36881 RepID=A0AAE0GEG0_9CHLO|nr:hypothetical protein CYMTET_15383 [Cymbomonas tetramitiformis]
MSDFAQACLQGIETFQAKQWREKEERWRGEDLLHRDQEILWRKEDKRWREEDRRWRHEDREWRGDDLNWRNEERGYARTWREEDRLWRRQDVEQRCLDNARWVWSRFVEKNRRDVEEKSEQLKTVSNLAALIAGFAVVALVELQFPADQPERYACSTSVTVGLMMNSMVLCSMMLSTVLKVGQNFVCEEEETKFLYECRNFVLNYDRGNAARNTPPRPTRTFAQTWDNQYDNHWRFAYSLFQCGVPCFMLALVFASWLKFNYSITTGVIVSTIMFASFVLFLWIQQMWV